MGVLVLLIFFFVSENCSPFYRINDNRIIKKKFAFANLHTEAKQLPARGISKLLHKVMPPCILLRQACIIRKSTSQGRLINDDERRLCAKSHEVVYKRISRLIGHLQSLFGLLFTLFEQSPTLHRRRTREQSRLRSFRFWRRLSKGGSRDANISVAINNLLETGSFAVRER